MGQQTTGFDSVPRDGERGGDKGGGTVWFDCKRSCAVTASTEQCSRNIAIVYCREEAGGEINALASGIADFIVL